MKKLQVNSKTFGVAQSCSVSPGVLWLMHLCFLNVTGNMITYENYKLQLSSKLVQNMHPSPLLI